MPLPTSWSERFPLPRTEPPRPDIKEPLTSENQRDWFLARYEWNKYVRAVRLHQMARALDELDALAVMRGGGLDPEQVIARNLAAFVLDGTLWQAAANLVEIMVAKP